MKILILNGSPKKNSTSKFLGRMTGALLTGCNIQYASLHLESKYPEILQKLKDINTLILAAPLYVDGIPSHVLDFLQQAEKFCRENNCHFPFPCRLLPDCFCCTNRNKPYKVHNGDGCLQISETAGKPQIVTHVSWFRRFCLYQWRIFL